MRRNHIRDVGHEELVAAAVALALAEGLHLVTLDAVAARCDVPLKAVLQVQPDPGPLVAEAFGRIVSGDLAAVKRTVLAHPSPERQLRTLVATLAEPVRTEVGLVWLASWSLGVRNPALGAAVREQQGCWHALVAAVVRRGVRSGEFLTVDPDDVAARILAVLIGGNAYALIGYRSDLDRMRLMSAIARVELGVRFDEAPAAGPLA